MPVSYEKARRVLGGFLGFVALSVVAAVVLTVGVMPAIAVTAKAADTGVSAFNGLPEFLKIPELDQTSTFYATQGSTEVPIATFYAQNRVDVAWGDVAPVVKDAAVATEDPRFYEEGGIDILGTIRGALSSASGSVQGGSSITQQYVKNVLLQQCSNDIVNTDASQAVQDAQEQKYQQCVQDAAGITVSRKLREMRYAVGLEKKYSKDQILMGYLNIAGFGGRIYGIQAAAEYYFGVSAKQLSLPQAATLVGMLNNPSNLRIDQDEKTNPGSNAKNKYQATLDRRNYVLSRMLANGKITHAQYSEAQKTPITPKITPVESGCMSATAYDAGFFCNYVQTIMLSDKAFGATSADRAALFHRGGLKVYTTLNLGLQKTAQASLSSYIPPTRQGMDLGGTNVSMQVGTGRIVNMVENRKYNDSGTPPAGTSAVNFATDLDYGGSAGFQTGSSFKAFDLVAWLESGHTLYERVNANQHNFNESEFPQSGCTPGYDGIPWQVFNDESSEGGYLSVMQATEDSVNTAFAQMGTEMDLCSVSNAAKALGVHSASPGTNPWTINPTMLIGTNYISPLTMATAYAAFANKGVVCTPIAIDKVIGNDGTELPVPKTTCSQAIPANIAATVGFALQHVMTNGTAYTANPFDGVPILGKTGTTDGAYDNWLVTSTTKVASAIWIGNIQGVRDANGVPQKTDMHYQYFQPKGGGYAVQGNDVKFSVMKPIIAALDQAYPGGALAQPDNSLLYPKYYFQPSPPKASTPPKAPPSTPGKPGKGKPGKGNG